IDPVAASDFEHAARLEPFQDAGEDDLTEARRPQAARVKPLSAPDPGLEPRRSVQPVPRVADAPGLVVFGDDGLGRAPPVGQPAKQPAPQILAKDPEL